MITKAETPPHNGHIFPDTVCNHPQCQAAFDSRRGEWRTSGAAGLIIRRDNWKLGRCPTHNQ